MDKKLINGNWFLQAAKIFISLQFVFFLLMPIAVFALENQGVGGKPAYPRDNNPRTKSIFVHNVDPGEKVNEGVILANSSAETKEVLVYAVDSLVSSNGGFACRQLVEPKEEVGSWVEMETQEITLKPYSNKLVKFDINVPLNASIGEHNGCIVVQEKPKTQITQNGMNIVFRSSMRIALTVDGELYRKLEIINFKAEKKDKNIYWLKPQIHNFGNVSIDTIVHVNTYNMFGKLVSTSGGEFPVMRGETSAFNFTFKDDSFWGGWFKSELEVKYDEDPESKVGVNVSDNLTVLKAKTKIYFIWPKPLGIALIALGLALIIGLIFLIFLFLFIIPKRSRWIKETWEDYEVLDGDNVKSLAKKYEVSWKLLVKVNNLKPPYILEVNTIIKVPPLKKSKKQKKKIENKKNVVKKVEKDKVKKNDVVVKKELNDKKNDKDNKKNNGFDKKINNKSIKKTDKIEKNVKKTEKEIKKIIPKSNLKPDKKETKKEDNIKKNDNQSLPVKLEKK